jgi:hypothetical protein
VNDVADPLGRRAGSDLGLLAEAACQCPPGRHQQVLHHTGPVGDRTVVRAWFDPQPVDLDRLPAVAGHVEQPGLDAGGGDPHTRLVRDQRRQRHAEGACHRVERAKGRIADPVLDFRQRALADARRLS